MMDPALAEGIRRRGKKFAHLLVSANAEKDGQRRKLQQELEQLQGQINQANKEIPQLSLDQKKERIAELKPLSDKIALLKEQISAAATGQEIFPNIPRPDVPEGNDESANVVLR